MSKSVVVVTGSSSGFGRMPCNALALAGHTVFASMRETTARNAPQVAEVEAFARKHEVDLRALELDVGSEESVQAAIARIVADVGRLDVVIHNAGHMVYGPAESFTPEQLAELYDINVLSTQRVNRAALPLLRKQRRGLLVWISSTGTIVRVVEMPFGTRPFRVHIDPAADGAGVVNVVADRMCAEFLRRIGLGDTLRAHAS